MGNSGRKTETKQKRKGRSLQETSKNSSRRRLRKILITGGTGFLGSHLLRALISSGERNLRVLSTTAPEWLSDFGVEVIQGSITSPEAVARAVKDVSAIYHLAGLVSREAEDAHRMYQLHVDGTRLLCDAAREAGTQAIILASTSGTIAVTEDGDEIPDETYPPPLKIITRWPYYASKYYQERVALERFDGDGRKLVILNPSLLLGPGDERLSSTKFILDFLAGRIMTVPSGGLSFVDARDAAQAFINALERGKHGERYLLGAVNWTFRELLGRLERLTKRGGPRFTLPSKFAIAGAQAIHALYRHWKLSPPLDPVAIEMAEYFWYVNPGKAERELSFAPRDPTETLHDTVEYVRERFLGRERFD
jgi:dihydroflavonol-4-reductase